MGRGSNNERARSRSRHRGDCQSNIAEDASLHAGASSALGSHTGIAGPEAASSHLMPNGPPSSAEDQGRPAGQEQMPNEAALRANSLRLESLLARFSALFENMQPPAAPSPQALQRIQDITFDDAVAANIKQDTQCVICCSEFQVGETLAQLPNCEHLYHGPCIRRWLERTASCPICRHVLSATGEGLSPGVVVRIIGSGTCMDNSSGTCMERQATGDWLVRLPRGELQQIKAENLEVTKKLGVGADVRLVDLASAAHLNGSRGHCVQWNHETGRWQVRLVSGEGKAVKPENLEVISPGRDEEGMASEWLRQAAGVMSDTTSMQQLVTTCREILTNPHGATLFQPVFQQIASDPEVQRSMGGLPGGGHMLSQVQHMARNPGAVQQMMEETFTDADQVLQNPSASARMRSHMTEDPQLQNLVRSMLGPVLGSLQRQ